MCTRSASPGPGSSLRTVRLRPLRTDLPARQHLHPGRRPQSSHGWPGCQRLEFDRPGGSGWAWGGPAGRRARGAVTDGLDACSRGRFRAADGAASRGRLPRPPAGHVPSAEGPTSRPQWHRVGASHVPSLRSSCHTRKQPSETR